MRTCPACGKDTRAESTEPCTRCGFSPLGESQESASESIGTIERGSGGATGYELPDPSAPDPTPDSSSGPSPSPWPSPTRTPTPTGKRSGFPVGAIWILILFGWLAFQFLGNLDGCAEALDMDEPAGPAASEVEGALRSDAAGIGLVGIGVECPESSEDTEVGETFDCTVTDLATGEEATVTVTNREDSFEWSRQGFVELPRGTQDRS